MQKLFKLIAVLTLSLMAFQAKAQNIALVLSFEDYQNGADIRGGLNDHNALLAAYRAAGYQTTGGRNRTKAQMGRLLENFVDALDDAETAVIQINGHVASFGNESWVLPSDTATNSLVAMELGGISVDFLLEILAKKPGKSVLFLGMAERDFANIPDVRRGVVSDDIPDGVMMVSGSMRDVSRAVLRDFLQQDAIVLEALANNRRLNFDGDIPYTLVLASDPPRPRVDTAEEIEAALGLSRNQRRAIQTDLSILGYNLGTIDGLFGNQTRGAIRNWQRHERLTQTGYLNADQLRLLGQRGDAARQDLERDERDFWGRTGAGGGADGLRAYLARYPNGLFSGRARDSLSALDTDSDRTEWERAADINTLLSYQRYLQRYPDGVYNRLAKVRVQEFLANIPAPNDVARRAEERLRLDNSSRLLIELRLAGLGFRVGAPDGVFDNATRGAIRLYQQDRGLPVTGYVTSDMIRLLLLGR